MAEREFDEGIVDPGREIIVTEPARLEDGKHTGTITNLVYRDTPFKYADLHIKPDGKDFELKVGYPQKISPGSALGDLLSRFGIQLVKGQNINLYKEVVGKKTEFVTISETVRKNGSEREYSRIVKESVRPLKQ